MWINVWLRHFKLISVWKDIFWHFVFRFEQIKSHKSKAATWHMPKGKQSKCYSIFFIAAHVLNWQIVISMEAFSVIFCILLEINTFSWSDKNHHRIHIAQNSLIFFYLIGQQKTIYIELFACQSFNVYGYIFERKAFMKNIWLITWKVFIAESGSDFTSSMHMEWQTRIRIDRHRWFRYL